MRNPRLVILLVLVWALLTFGPLLGALLTERLAAANGCPSLESGSPCLILGMNVVSPLAELVLIGVLVSFVTVPVGVLVGVVGLVAWWITTLVSARRARRETGPYRLPVPPPSDQGRSG